MLLMQRVTLKNTAWQKFVILWCGFTFAISAFGSEQQIITWPQDLEQAAKQNLKISAVLSGILALPLVVKGCQVLYYDYQRHTKHVKARKKREDIENGTINLLTSLSRTDNVPVKNAWQPICKTVIDEFLGHEHEVAADAECAAADKEYENRKEGLKSPSNDNVLVGPWDAVRYVPSVQFSEQRASFAACAATMLQFSLEYPVPWAPFTINVPMINLLDMFFLRVAPVIIELGVEEILENKIQPYLQTLVGKRNGNRARLRRNQRDRYVNEIFYGQACYRIFVTRALGGMAIQTGLLLFAKGAQKYMEQRPSASVR